jgi:serine phosphatase RsbU (regulator of sigma subunit)
MAQLATVFYARLQPTPHADGTGAPWTLRYASAGHPPPLVALPDGAIRTLDAALSPVIGAPSVDAVRPEAELALPSGAVLVGYTDGLVEGRRRPIDDGIDLLRGVLRRTPADATAEELCEAVLAGLVDDDREDDVAILVLRVR